MTAFFDNGMKNGPASSLGRSRYHRPERGERKLCPAAGIPGKTCRAKPGVHQVDCDSGDFEGEVFGEPAVGKRLDELAKGIPGLKYGVSCL